MYVHPAEAATEVAEANEIIANFMTVDCTGRKERALPARGERKK